MAQSIAPVLKAVQRAPHPILSAGYVHDHRVGVGLGIQISGGVAPKHGHRQIGSAHVDRFSVSRKPGAREFFLHERQCLMNGSLMGLTHIPTSRNLSQ